MAKLGLTRHKLRKQGFGLVLILGFAAILAVFTAGIGAQAASNLRGVQLRGETDRAYYASYTGVQCTVSCLREPPAWTNPDGTDYNWLRDDRALVLDLESGAQSVTRLFHNIPGYPEPDIEAPDGTKIPENHFYIISMGIVDGVYDGNGDLVGGTKFETNVMGAALSASFPTTPHAAFACDTTNGALTIEGTINHFDSRTADAASDMNCSYPEASVATDAQTSEAVALGVDCAIDGHVLLGVGTPGPELDEVATTAGGALALATGAPNSFAGTRTVPGGNNSDRVNGNITVQSSARSRVEMKVPTDLAAANIFSVSDGLVTTTRTLDEGKVYLQKGSLTVDGGAIEVRDSNSDGRFDDILILVEDNITFRGAGPRVNANKPPLRVKLYSLATDGASEFRMEGQADAHCLVAGEAMSAFINPDSDLWGAVLAKTVKVESGGAIHYDVALRDPGLMADIYGYTVLSSSSTGGATNGLQVSAISPAPAPAAPVAPPAAPAPAPAPGAPAAPAPAPAPAPAAGCGCGCGCGGGSMMLGLKAREAAMN